MIQNFNSNLACLVFMVTSIFFNASYGMKRAGNHDDDRGDSKHPKIEKRYPLSQQIIDLEQDEASVINCSCISPDGELLAVGYEDGLVKIWDADNGLLISVLCSKKKGPVSKVKWSPDSNYVLALIEASDPDEESSLENQIDLETQISANNENDLDDATYIDYPNDCRLVVFWKKDNNRTFKKRHESCHSMDMADIKIIDITSTNDAKLIIFTSAGLDARSYDPKHDFKLLTTHWSEEFDENNELWGKKICTYADGEYCLCGFKSFNEENKEPKATLKLFHHLKSLFCFEFAGKLIDCALSHHNHILVLTRDKKQSSTIAACHSFIHNSTGTWSENLFTLEHDNSALEKLYYSSECAFIIGHANQHNAPAVVFVWDRFGKPLRKIAIESTHENGQIKLYVAKIVDTILTLIFADDERSWSVLFDLANTHQNIMKREYGAKPSVQDIRFESLLLSIDQEGEFSIKTMTKK